MPSFLRAVLIVLPGLLGSTVLAQDREAAGREAAVMEAYGDAQADCQEWTDTCRVCRRRDAGAPACSTAGIACTPRAIACTATKAR